MSVEDEVAPPRIDRLGEEVAAEERIDLQAFAAQGFLDGGVVGQRETDVGVESPSSFSSRCAVAFVWWMNAFISGSPNSEPHAPANPPPKP